MGVRGGAGRRAHQCHASLRGAEAPGCPAPSSHVEGRTERPPSARRALPRASTPRHTAALSSNPTMELAPLFSLAFCLSGRRPRPGPPWPAAMHCMPHSACHSEPAITRPAAERPLGRQQRAQHAAARCVWPTLTSAGARRARPRRCRRGPTGSRHYWQHTHTHTTPSRPHLPTRGEGMECRCLPPRPTPPTETAEDVIYPRRPSAAPSLFTRGRQQREF